jgi:hypothetical protein
VTASLIANPLQRMSMSRIRADGPPTDYFPAPEFDKIMDATYIYQPKGWVECRNQATRLRILTSRTAGLDLIQPSRLAGVPLEQVSMLLGHIKA